MKSADTVGTMLINIIIRFSYASRCQVKCAIITEIFVPIGLISLLRVPRHRMLRPRVGVEATESWYAHQTSFFGILDFE